MSTPLFLVEPPALITLGAGSSLVLDGEEGRHAATVRRIGAGERVDVADGHGRVARCVVVAAGRDRLELLVDEVDFEFPPTPRVVLVQALAKGGRDELAVETATEVGIDAVAPWQASRSIVMWKGERGEKSQQRWVATARAAAKQSRRVRVPEILPAVDTAGVVRLVADSALALVLHESAAEPLTSIAVPADGDIVLVVGPEGGIDERELAAFSAAGARAVRLGSHVLRSSTAGTAATVVLAVRLGRW